MYIVTLFIWFILYSILGWIYETIYCSVKALKWDNRGMLLGPYCPIYGVGAVLDVLLCSDLPGSLTVFFVCMIGATILEYVTSYATEKMFHAVWWDYSRLPFNIKGRVCLQCSAAMGVAGVLVQKVIHPYMARLTDAVPHEWLEVIAMLFMAVFAADCALTADSLIALNVKLEAMVKSIDTQISEKYDAFIENTKQNLSEGLGSLKEKVSLEEFREKKTKEELKKALSTMNWAQMRTLRSPMSFRREKYGELGSKMKNALSFRRKKYDETEEQK